MLLGPVGPLTHCRKGCHEQPCSDQIAHPCSSHWKGTTSQYMELVLSRRQRAIASVSLL